MSTAQKPDGHESGPVGLTPRGKARLAEIKARNAMVVAISNESWGTKLTPIQQRAFAEYMRRFNLDISEIDNLGGRPYRNGRYYMRRIAELAAEGRVEWYRGDHIGPDPRLDALERAGDEWAKGENTRRLRERIRLAVPPTATFAYVVTVKMKELAEPTEGCKFYEPGRTKLGWSKTQRGQKEEVSADPVGDANPSTSVETRAWRRCGRLCAAEIPELRDQEAEMEFAADATQEAVIAEAVRADEEQERATVATHPIDHGGDDPYGTAPKAITEGAAQPVPVPASEPEYEFQDDRDLVD